MRDLSSVRHLRLTRRVDAGGMTRPTLAATLLLVGLALGATACDTSGEVPLPAPVSVPSVPGGAPAPPPGQDDGDDDGYVAPPPAGGQEDGDDGADDGPDDDG
jgi:hypothetical protein